MAFQKFGSPQKMTILSGTCQVCNSAPAKFNINGKMICEHCKLAQEHINQEELETNEVK